MNRESFKRTIRILRRKKWPLVLFVVLIAVVITAPFVIKTVNAHNRFAVKNTTPLSRIILVQADREKICLSGHHGFGAQAPENTTVSIEKARDYGFNSVELDLRQTSDGVWVLCHDADVSAVTDKRGLVSSYTYYDLITCNIDCGANIEKYENLKIPTLEQALKSCLERNTTPVLDIKSFNDDGIETLLDIIDKNGFTESCSILSADMSLIEKIHKTNPDIKLYFTTGRLTDKSIQKTADIENLGICFDGSKSREKDIEKAVDKKILLLCRNVNDKEAIKRYYKLGVTDFITDTVYPM